MKQFNLITAVVLLSVLGATAPVYAQKDDHTQDSQGPKQDQQAKPAEQQPAKPEAQKQPERGAQQQKPQQPEREAQQQRPQQKAAPAQQGHQQVKPQQQQASSNTREPQQQTPAAKQPRQQQAKSEPAQTKQNAPQEQARNQNQRSTSSRPPQRTEEAQTRQRTEPALRLSAVGSGRIPEARFQSNFGRSHEFRINSPRMVDGYSRFQSGGVWFGFVQPWPADWYYTDDVYVDYIGGQYYLCNPYYPGQNLSISVVL